MLKLNQQKYVGISNPEMRLIDVNRQIYGVFDQSDMIKNKKGICDPQNDAGWLGAFFTKFIYLDPPST